MALSCTHMMQILKDHGLLYHASLPSPQHATTEIFSVVLAQRYIHHHSHTTAPPSTAQAVVLYKGHRFDHHQRLDELLELSQPPALFVLEDSACNHLLQSHAFFVVTSGRQAWALLMHAIAGKELQQLHFVGITGTNGKTSTTLMLFALLQHFSIPTLALGTFGYRLSSSLHATPDLPFFSSTPSLSSHTTQDPDILYPLLRRAQQQGVQWVVMEVSSHSLAQDKLFPLIFDVVVGTSFSQDHLDFHPTMEEYFAQKCKLFAPPYCGPHTKRILTPQLFKTLRELPRSFSIPSELFSFPTSSSSLSLCSSWDHALRASPVPAPYFHLALLSPPKPYWISTRTPHMGTHTLENLLTACYLTSHITARDLLQVCTVSSDVIPSSIPGRMQQISNSPLIVIDYAHSPQALRKALCALAQTFATFRLLCVVGCGGNRDVHKRPLMARIALRYAHQVIFTTDNPRDEDPKQILHEMWQGLSLSLQKRGRVVVDRKEALWMACEMGLAAQRDRNPFCILIAGRGNERQQWIQGKAHPFHDRQVVQDCLQEIAAVHGPHSLSST